MDLSRLQANLDAVRSAIADAARRAGRSPFDVLLVAVTKRRSPALVRALHDLGVRDFGENYPQELWEKVAALPGLDARWHLIGHLQGNKVARTAPMTRVIHSVDSLKLLKALDALAPSLPHPPDVLLQVNVSGEASKHGFSAQQVIESAVEIAGCRNVPIVGLMTMAPLGTDAESARPTFRRLREVAGLLADRTGLPLPHLSMGMSGDYEAAVEEGATLVRVGSALFEGVEP